MELEDEIGRLLVLEDRRCMHVITTIITIITITITITIPSIHAPDVCILSFSMLLHPSVL
jgi:hypothetical protein